MDQPEFSNGPLAQKLFALLHRWKKPVVLRHHQLHAGRACGIDHLGRLRDGAGDGLLHEDVFGAAGGREGVLEVQMVRSQAVHGIDAGIGKSLFVAAKVARAVELIAVPLRLFNLTTGEVELQFIAKVVDVVEHGPGVAATSHDAQS